ncbi:MAG TPA: hypothetical protein VMV69_00005 [Pirellulales bacterium]|nr:hypothetical protein [Pirellulales bacterium]
MTIEQLRKMHQERPFQPFDVHLADGRAIPVEHPEFLSQSPKGRTISIGLADGTHEVVDLLLVSACRKIRLARIFPATFGKNLREDGNLSQPGV